MNSKRIVFILLCLVAFLLLLGPLLLVLTGCERMPDTAPGVKYVATTTAAYNLVGYRSDCTVLLIEIDECEYIYFQCPSGTAGTLQHKGICKNLLHGRQ